MQDTNSTSNNGCESWIVNKDRRESEGSNALSSEEYIMEQLRQNWRTRTNGEIMDMLYGEGIVRIMKSQRLRWFRHIQRIEDNRMPKNILKNKINAIRNRGKPRVRWQNQVLGDMVTIGITGRGTQIIDRIVWSRMVKKFKAHPSMQRLDVVVTSRLVYHTGNQIITLFPVDMTRISCLGVHNALKPQNCDTLIHIILFRTRPHMNIIQAIIKVTVQKNFQKTPTYNLS